MSENKKVDLHDIIFNVEFQNQLDFSDRNEISMVSKLAREKLKPAVFKRVAIHSANIELYSRVFPMAILSQEDDTDIDYFTLREEYEGDIKISLSYIKLALQCVTNHTKSLCLSRLGKAAYFLFPIINNFDSLAELEILYCNIPFNTFADIGKSLPNLNNLTLEGVSLVKSHTDIISSSDIIFPSSLKSLIINYIQVNVTSALSDLYEYLFRKVESYSFEYFTLPKISLPFLKKLQYIPVKNFSNDYSNQELEEFLGLNPNLESLIILNYNLKKYSNLSSLKYLRADDTISFNNIDNISSLNSINSLSFNIETFENTEKFRKLCMLCTNLVELELTYNGSDRNSQAFIDNFLTPALPSLLQLKSLQFYSISNADNNLIFDFTKFNQVENLEMMSCGFISNIKFENCKSLKQVKFIFSDDDITEEFIENLNKYENWTFKYEDFEVVGNRI
jgi:hypothetical protein